MSMDNDIVAAASPYRRQRHLVYHKDGPDQEFWESSYFIPGISGRPRCLTTTTTSTTQDSPLQLRSSKSVNDNTIDDNSHDDCDSLTIDSLKLKDIRSWCSASALRHGQELERFGENNETNEIENRMKEQERAMEGNSSYMLPNVLLQKDDTTTVSKQSSHDNSRNDPPPSSALLCDQGLVVVDNLSETKTNQSENLMKEQEEGIGNSSLPNVLLPSPSSVFLLDQEQECSKKKTNKTKNLTNEQERMGSSLPNVLLQKEHTITTTLEPSCHRSDTDLCKATMTIEEELRELLKFMHDNREGSLRM